VTGPAPSALSRFRAEYGAHRAAEGRRQDRAELFALPYVRSGPFARQWAVRARTFEAFVTRVLEPATRELRRPLRLLDLGAGNGWLCWRAARIGVSAVALDVRDDDVDGLGAAKPYVEQPAFRFGRVVASFDALPFGDGRFDLVVFNAALHYAVDLTAVLREARRAVHGSGRIVVLDSPFYAEDDDGEAMVAEKRHDAAKRFGSRAEALMSLPCIEYLTRDRLTTASAGLGLAWRRHRIRYPLWYEARPLAAWLRRQRKPSRFDMWECTVA
jgi:SAM-dependent methyltransferase